MTVLRYNMMSSTHSHYLLSPYTCHAIYVPSYNTAHFLQHFKGALICLFLHRE